MLWGIKSNRPYLTNLCKTRNADQDTVQGPPISFYQSSNFPYLFKKAFKILALEYRSPSWWNLHSLRCNIYLVSSRNSYLHHPQFLRLKRTEKKKERKRGFKKNSNCFSASIRLFVTDKYKSYVTFPQIVEKSLAIWTGKLNLCQLFLHKLVSFALSYSTHG